MILPSRPTWAVAGPSPLRENTLSSKPDPQRQSDRERQSHQLKPRGQHSAWALRRQRSGIPRVRRRGPLRRVAPKARSDRTRGRRRTGRVALCQCKSTSLVLRTRSSPAPTPPSAAPHRKDRLQSGAFHLLFPVAAHVFKEEVAKCDSLDAFGDCPGTGLSHPRLILFIGARPRQRNGPERKPDSRSLLLNQFSSNRMHGNATRAFVECGQQPCDFMLGTLAKNVKTPRAVFAAAPGKKDALHADCLQRSARSC